MAEDTKKRDLEPGVAPAGRVVKDQRGRTVWQWSEEERSSSTSVLLKYLDNEALSLEPTQTVPVPPDAEPRATGGEATESTSVVLKRLENDALSLEPTRQAPALRVRRGGDPWAGSGAAFADETDAADEAADPGEEAGGGFNPYDHG